ncbi:MAG TPA: radical SAM protein [Candidatus Methylomirabilis sp.]|nr:radical SAM protein [Candidatus Methylomirabilis sp.]
MILPPEVASRHGLRPGARLRIEDGGNGLRLRQPVCHLAKVYVEATNRCNLACRTCIRNTWDEPLGQMETTTFSRVMGGLRAFSPSPAICFGGFGEPLAHPNIVEMVAQAKALGGRVELITNGTLLTKDVSQGLIATGLDMLWVSLDGATPESYVDVRLGAALPEVLANLKAFRDARKPDPDRYRAVPYIGIAFVMMKRNVADLPAVLRLGERLGATRFMVTNLLPYSRAMCQETLYPHVLSNLVYSPSMYRLELPKMDVSPITRKSLYEVMRGGLSIRLAGGDLAEATDRCPFIEQGVTTIGWDGSVSPCLSLLHSHVSFLHDQERVSRRYVVGKVTERDVRDLWSAPEYVAFRERVQAFDFSPCTECGGCNLSETNDEDCFGNPFPTCGGCLWAQGLIQCP